MIETPGAKSEKIFKNRIALPAFPTPTSFTSSLPHPLFSLISQFLREIYNAHASLFHSTARTSAEEHSGIVSIHNVCVSLGIYDYAEVGSAVLGTVFDIAVFTAFSIFYRITVYRTL